MVSTESLKVLIEEWFINQSNFPENISLRISASKEDVQIYIQSNPLIIDCLRRDSLPEEFNNHLISVTRNIIIRKIRGSKVEWNNANLFDFLNLFPTKRIFNNRKGVGKGSIKLMNLILTDNNLFWPDR